MKILKMNSNQINLAIFLLLSLVFLHSMYCLSVGATMISVNALKAFFANHVFVFVFTLFATYSVLKFKGNTKYYVLLSLVFICLKSFLFLSDNFNKLILISTFIYLIFAFYFFIVWELETGLAAYNPNFSQYDLEKEARFKIFGNLVEKKTGEVINKFSITNLDVESCFLILDDSLSARESYTGKRLEIECNYEGVRFVQPVEVVSRFDRGIGLLFLNNGPNTNANYSELYNICLERSILVQS